MAIALSSVVAAVALYVLTAPFVISICIQNGVGLETILQIYAPLVYLSENSETFEDVMGSYCRLVYKLMGAP